MKKLLCLIGVGCLFVVSANATLVVDNFNRVDGDLAGTNPTPGPGGTWTNHSGSGSFIQISSGQAVVTHGSGSREDAHTTFAGLSTGLLEANFDATVNATNVITGGDYEYFAHFMTEGSFNFRSRLDVVEGTQGGDYTFGISSGSSTAETIFPVDFDFGIPINVTLGFDLNTGVGSLTIGATTISGTGVFLGETLDSFALRQSFSSLNETILIDNLNIIPEPGTLALLALGMGAMAIRRRR